MGVYEDAMPCILGKDVPYMTAWFMDEPKLACQQLVL